MKRVAEALGVSIALTTLGVVVAEADSADIHADYYAARSALEQGDCDAAVRHLNAYVRDNPHIPERQPDFYSEIERVVGQCTGTVRIRGVEGESAEIDPLPDRPPTAD